MKPRKFFPVLVAAILPFTLFGQLIDRPVATVRLTTTTVITERQIQAKIDLLQEELGLALSAEQKMSLLQSEVDTELIMQAARRQNLLASAEEISSAIQQQRQSLGIPSSVSEQQFRQLITQQTQLTWEEYQERLSRRIIQEKYIVQDNQAFLSQPYTPGEDEILRTYEENIQDFLAPAYVRFDHLFIDTRGLAAAEKNLKRQQMDGFLTEVRSGGRAAFDRLVIASLDDVSYTGGDFGFLPRGEQTTTQLLGRNFIDSVFALGEGAISAVLESSLGFHIVKITQKRSPRLLELGDPVSPGGSLTVRQQIIQYLQSQKVQERLTQAVTSSAEKLRSEAEVQIFQQNINWN